MSYQPQRKNPGDEIQQTLNINKNLNEIKGQRNVIIVLTVLLLLSSLYLGRKYLTAKTDLDILNPKAKKLEQLNESKDQLFAIVAHDLRTTVFILQINITKIKSLLLEGMKAEAEKLAGETEQVISTTQSLLSNLLYWSLSQTGQISYNPERLPLQALIDQVTYDYLPLAATKEMVFHQKLTPALFCKADLNSIKIVLRNLLDNAIKYTPPKGIIFITAWEAGGRCYIGVQDTGIGMDEELVHAIVENDSKRIQNDTYGRRGTGIGLWLSKSMTEKNEGWLTITSVKGIGTTITINLPADLTNNESPNT